MKTLCLKITLLLLAACFIGIGGFAGVNTALRWWAERPITGALVYDEVLQHPLLLDAGPFRIAWHTQNGGGLRVTHIRYPAKILWETIPGRAFVGAAFGNETVTEHRGMFFFNDRIRQRYHLQHIERIYQRDGDVVVEGFLESRDGDRTDYTLSLGQPVYGRLAFALETDRATVNRTYLTYASYPDESFYGFGAQFSHFDLKGKRVPVFVMEQGIGRGQQPLTFLVNLVARAGGAWHTSYAVVPHYLTSKLRSLFLTTSEYAVFDLRQSGVVQIALFAPDMTGCILAGNSPADLIAEYTGATGRMRPLPDWILEGAVIGMQGGTEKVQQVWEMLREHDTPVAAFWLQDWVGQRRTIVGKQLWWNWELDRSHYPGWEELVSEWDAAGVRVMTYINPFLVDPSIKGACERNLFQEAMRLGYLVRTRDNQPYLIQNTDFSAAMIDLGNPDAREWIKAVIRDQMISIGASGWMADFGEALPYDARLHGDVPAAAYHNRYPETWARVNREAIEETGRGNEFVFFMRSGYRESPRYATLFWLGDQMVTWDRHDGMKSAVTGLLSSGLSGFAFNHSDIGGYTAIDIPVFAYKRDKELLLRWMELNAFSVVFRTHEGVAPDANHQFYSDEETFAHFDRCARIYAAWADYRKDLVMLAGLTGLPVVRHPFIHYPDDARVRAINHEQFMVGDALMVVPVLDAGVRRVHAYLPEGPWTHLWTGTHYAPGKTGLDVQVDAPLGQPAVFYKTNSPDTTVFIESLRKQGLL